MVPSPTETAPAAGAAPDLSGAALRVRGLSKVYGGTVALAGVDFTVRPGEIHALLGENGAGKSTLVKLVAGIEPADGGTVEVNGHLLPPQHRPHDADAAGAAFIHQQLGLVGSMSVGENIALVAGYPRSGRRIDWMAVREQARRALARMGVNIDPDEELSSLPVSAQQVVAIARALAKDARMLVLDEPTASLTVAEVSVLFEVLRRLRDEGVAIVYISHRLDEVRRICDRVTILRDGNLVATREMATTTDAELVTMIVGTDVSDVEIVPAAASEKAVEFIEVSGPTVRAVSFTVRRGEVIGVAGLSGSGHAEIGGLLFGLAPVLGGEITVDGRAHRPAAVSEAIAGGIAYVPADRNVEAAAVELSLQENLDPNPDVAVLARLSRREERRRAESVLRDFDVRPPEPARVFSTLSGGNAQKVVLARWMTRNPSVIVLNDPTAAVDIGARREIHARLREAAANGASVVVISSDMEEIEELCDRAVVIRAGRLVATLERDEINVPELTRRVYEAA
jgi:ribose transport system ATP-binding protein